MTAMPPRHNLVITCGRAPEALAAELFASDRYTAHHFALTKRDYDAAISAGRRFESIRGEPLATAAEVKDALKADGEVVSRC